MASVLAQPVQLAEKVIAMNRLVNELGSPDGGSAPEAVAASPSILQAVAGEWFIVFVHTSRDSFCIYSPDIPRGGRGGRRGGRRGGVRSPAFPCCAQNPPTIFVWFGLVCSLVCVCVHGCRENK